MSCQSSENEYSIKTLKRARSSGNAIVIARVNEKPDVMLPVCALKVDNDKIYESDSIGSIVFNIESGTYKFTGLSIHFEPVIIERIQINAEDSLIIDFFLKPDKQPLYEN